MGQRKRLWYRNLGNMDSRTRVSLLERLRDGTDSVAWRDFFVRYWRAMYAFAKHQGCSNDTAEDVVQNTMVTVFEKRGVFRHDPSRGRFRNWLFTVVRQKLALHRRQGARELRARGEQAAGLVKAQARDAPPDVAWQSAFECSLLLALLEQVRCEVSPETYQAFELTTLHELPGREVGELTGMSRNAVYLSRKRVLKRLRQLGAPYRREGQLHQRLKDVLAVWPSPATERALMTRIETTMQSVTEGHHE